MKRQDDLGVGGSIFMTVGFAAAAIYNPQNEAYIKNKTKRIYLTFVWKQKIKYNQLIFNEITSGRFTA